MLIALCFSWALVNWSLNYINSDTDILITNTLITNTLITNTLMTNTLMTNTLMTNTLITLKYKNHRYTKNLIILI